MRTFSSIYVFNASRFDPRAAICVANGAQGGNSGGSVSGRRKGRPPEEFKKDNGARVRRVNKWITDCRNTGNRDAHTQFVFHWIAFDAMVSDDDNFDQSKMRLFLARIVQLDNKKTVLRALKECEREIRKILELRYTMPTFWKQHRHRKGLAKKKHFDQLGLGNSKTQAKNQDDWEEEFRHAREAGKSALQDALDGHGGKENMANALKSLFERLYVVRLQIFHGGSSRQDSCGRTQAEAGAKVLNELVPCFAKIMEQNKDEDWGKVPFPRCKVNSPPPWLE